MKLTSYFVELSFILSFQSIKGMSSQVQGFQDMFHVPDLHRKEYEPFPIPIGPPFQDRRNLHSGNISSHRLRALWHIGKPFRNEDTKKNQKIFFVCH